MPALPDWAFSLISQWLLPSEVLTLSAVCQSAAQASRSEYQQSVFWLPLLRSRLGVSLYLTGDWNECIGRSLRIGRNWRSGVCQVQLLKMAYAEWPHKRARSATLLPETGILIFPDWSIIPEDDHTAWVRADHMVKRRWPARDEPGSPLYVQWLAMVGGEEPPPRPCAQLLRESRPRLSKGEPDAHCWITVKTPEQKRWFLGFPKNGDEVLVGDHNVRNSKIIRTGIPCAPLGGTAAAEMAVVIERQRILLATLISVGSSESLPISEIIIVEKHRQIRCVAANSWNFVEGSEAGCRLRELKTDRVLCEHLGYAVTAVAINSEGVWAYGDRDGNVKLNHMPSEEPEMYESPAYSMAASCTPTRLSETDGISSCESPAFAHSVTPPLHQGGFVSKKLCHSSAITSLAFCGPLEQYLAVGQAAGMLTVWHQSCASPIVEVCGLPGSITELDADFRRILLVFTTPKNVRLHTLLRFD